MFCCAKDNVVTESHVSFKHHPIPRRAPPLLLLLAVRAAFAFCHKQGKPSTSRRFVRVSHTSSPPQNSNNNTVESLTHPFAVTCHILMMM